MNQPRPLRALTRTLLRFAMPVALSVGGLAVGGLSQIGCQPRTTVDLAQTGQLHIALSDPALLDSLSTYIAAMFDASSAIGECPTLLDAMPASLEEGSGLVSSQLLSAKDGENDSQHTFGKITEAGRYSFLLLGSRLQLPSEPVLSPLSDSAGTVIAAGCQDVDVKMGQQIDLNVVLYPVGLR